MEGTYGVTYGGEITRADIECLSLIKSFQEGWWPPKYIVMRDPFFNEDGK
jgi:hypothetical protein